LDGIRRRLTPKFQAFWLDKDIPRSPLRHLLTSNLAPSDSEVITIRALITDAEVRIEELHRRFPTHNSASQGTESKLLKFIEAHKALLSPVRYLPSEILQEIFLRYPACGTLHPPLAMIPWSLGHISRRWREIALSLPSLWDSIPGIDISSSSHAKRSYVRALTYLIQRSDTSPTLKLNIYCPPRKMKIMGYSILKVIIHHSERIECLSMSILPMHTTFMREFQELRGRLPNLRVLALSFPSTFSVAERSLDIFETAPALRQVILAGSSRPGCSIRLILPLSQITHFHDILNSERIAPYVSLSSLPSLTYLYIDKAMFDGTPMLRSPYEPVILPGLRTLKIHGHCKGGDTGVFLESLTVPSVEFPILDHSSLALLPCSLDPTSLLGCRSLLSALSHFKQEN
jgi:F-box-like